MKSEFVNYFLRVASFLAERNHKSDQRACVIINKTIMNMQRTYDFFAHRGLTRSARHFSVYYCDRGSNYLCLNRNYQASAELLVHLARKLRAEGHSPAAFKLLTRTALELWRQFRS
jgi:hypothetical protein